VAYGNGQFVVVGYACGSTNCDGTILTSTDGVNWVLRKSVTGNGLSAIAYGNGLFVAVGNYMLTSADGVQWTDRQIEGSDAITFGNGQFVVVDGIGIRGSRIRTSVDGVNWTQHPWWGTTDYLADIAYGKGMFVAVGGSWINVFDRIAEMTITTSTDGVRWDQRSPEVENGFINSIAYGNGLFVASTGDSRGEAPILSSTDGVNWKHHQVGANGGAIAYGNGHFLWYRGDMTILQSGNIINLSITPSTDTGLLDLSLEGPTGLTYTIQSSTNLVSWQNLTNVIIAQPLNVIFSALPAASENMFYRASAP
jgi:hypothetical protein